MARKTKTTQPFNGDDLDALLNAQMKTLGIDESSMKSEEDFDNVEFVSSGIPELDEILGDGHGIPRGTFVEMGGESGSGKTTAATMHAAEYQKLGHRVAFMNIENSFYPPRAKELGLDLSKDKFRLFENIGAAETWAELIKFIIDSGHFGIIIVDSVAAMIPKDDYDKDFHAEARVGAHAKFIKRFAREMMERSSKSQTTVIAINHLYFGAGAVKGQMVKQSTGGQAMTFFPHMRLLFKKIGGAAGAIVKKVGAKDVVLGNITKVTVIKTRYSQPMLTADMRIMYKNESENPVEEFLYRASSKGIELVKFAHKKYSLAHPDTGEVVENPDPIAFAKQLQGLEPPAKKKRGEESESMFDHICFALKLSVKAKAGLRSAVSGENVGPVGLTVDVGNVPDTDEDEPDVDMTFEE